MPHKVYVWIPETSACVYILFSVRPSPQLGFAICLQTDLILVLNCKEGKGSKVLVTLIICSPCRISQSFVGFVVGEGEGCRWWSRVSAPVGFCSFGASWMLVPSCHQSLYSLSVWVGNNDSAKTWVYISLFCNSLKVRNEASLNWITLMQNAFQQFINLYPWVSMLAKRGHAVFLSWFSRSQKIKTTNIFFISASWHFNKIFMSFASTYRKLSACLLNGMIFLVIVLVSMLLSN